MTLSHTYEDLEQLRMLRDMRLEKCEWLMYCESGCVMDQLGWGTEYR